MVRIITLLLFAFSLQAQNFQVSTAAGTGAEGDLTGTAAGCEFYYPYGVVTDYDSTIYIVDVLNHRIKKLNYHTQVVSNVAGNGIQGHADGVGAAAQLDGPVGLCYTNGFLYVAESGSWIRKIDVSTNMVSTIAGTGANGFQDGAALQAMFYNPTGVWADANGDVYVADYFNHCIRLISGGIVSTFAGVPGSNGFTDGPAALAKFDHPRNLIRDAKGDLYIADLLNNAIRKISGGVVTTFAGNGTEGDVDGVSSTARFAHPTGICAYKDGSFLVTDAYNHKIKKLDSLGTSTTIAGTGSAGYNDGNGLSAMFHRPEGIVRDSHGAIYVGDSENNRVRKLSIFFDHYANETYNAKAEVEMFPNPVSNKIGYKLAEQQMPCNYSICDMIGNVIRQGSLSTLEGVIEMNGLIQGNYLLRFFTPSAVLTRKIALQGN